MSHKHKKNKYSSSKKLDIDKLINSSKSIKEQAKKLIQIGSYEAKIASLYLKLGKLTYEQYSHGTDNDKKIKNLIENIKELDKNI